MTKKLSELEETFALHVRAAKLPEPEREFRFHKERMWRFDFAWPKLPKPVAVECEGGSWINGGHNRGKLFEDNCLKYNEAAMDGWVVLRFTMAQIKSGYAVDAAKRVIRGQLPRGAML